MRCSHNRRWPSDKIESITDLPVRIYPTDILPSEMIDDAAVMDALRAQVKSDIEGVLEKYDIEDVATLQRFYGVLANIALWEGRDDDAVKYIEMVRDLEDQGLRPLHGRTERALTRGAQAAVSPAQMRTSRPTPVLIRERLADMPWDVVQDAVQGSKGARKSGTEPHARHRRSADGSRRRRDP